ncbi:MAG: AMP-binding protein [Desulfuromonadales bacterium]|nr:AMP-binding protein [Desulfuromonadales bacterium]
MGVPNAALELLEHNLRDHPDKTAYLCSGRPHTYRELGEGARRLALQLRERGLSPGDRVLVSIPDCFAFPVVFLGCLLSGAVAVVVNPELEREALAQVVNDADARLRISLEGSAASWPACSLEEIVCDEVGPLERTGPVLEFCDAFQPADGDFAYALYTSGSTGVPKGVPHRHRSLVLPCDLVGKAVLGLTGKDVLFSTSKCSFAYGLINSLALPLRLGATAILYPGKPDPAAVLEIIRRHRPSVLFSVPTFFAQILRSWPEVRQQLPMRFCCSAGEALPAALFQEWQRLTGLEILDGIGSTEMAYHFISNAPGHAVAGSAGRLVPGYRARLVDELGQDSAPGQEGQLLVDGPTRTPGSWRPPDAAADAAPPPALLATGDVFVERDGFYYHRGRSDDMIKSAGCWVSPTTVEEVLLGHPAVAECAVVATRVGVFSGVGAFVVLGPGEIETPELVGALRRHCRERLPDHMCPARIRFVAGLPRTSTGKVQRFKLRERCAP